jgi:NAD(P)-dependent dehydrogenase (short-subunit alcohol dehydrogenase family)
MDRLKNKVAIVTGGSTGIGEAISKKFAMEGAKVLVVGKADEPVNEVVEEIKEKGFVAAGFIGDISEKSEAKECVEECILNFGKLDILINNAGVFPEINQLQDYSLGAFQFLIKNNIQSFFMVTKFALPELIKTKGNIVNAGSEAGQQGLDMNVVYGGTKGFIHSFTKGLAIEQARNGIRVNSVCPGPIDTGWMHEDSRKVDFRMEEQIINSTVMGRRGTPEEVANVYLFLASDESSYVTGALYPVGGGILIAKGPAGKEANPFFKKSPKGNLDLRHQLDSKTSLPRNGNGHNGNGHNKNKPNNN